MFTENVQLYLEDFKDNLQKAIEHLSNEFVKIRAGRANPKLVENIKVDYYGTPTPLYQMASISVPEARLLVISPWDMSAVKNVVKAIEEANLGLHPSDDGRNIRLSFPALTEERRRELVKEISKITEQSKVTCRNKRRDVLDVFKKMKKDNEITEDELERIEKEVQKILDNAISKIDNLYATKEKELLEI